MYQPYQMNSQQYFNVNGYEQAKQFQVAPNQTVLLIDTLEPYLYMKSANQIGQVSLKMFRLEEMDVDPDKQAENERWKAFDERLKSLEVKLNG